ncbi:hypothetical protein AsAng_0001820 [Aureispira anguillae]|uniref:Uncharacterized protein n=1 Tax=Aureispira anguillae TaxID=2864201 RepID=A0A915VK44_9BACT|nr:hypothetical protein AsAng_0001820 [Aureispira anguillae]
MSNFIFKPQNIFKAFLKNYFCRLFCFSFTHYLSFEVKAKVISLFGFHKFSL